VTNYSDSVEQEQRRDSRNEKLGSSTSINQYERDSNTMASKHPHFTPCKDDLDRARKKIDRSGTMER
jgi:hypothetical protein